MPILNSRATVKAQDKQGNPIKVPEGLGLRQAGPRVLVTLTPLEAQLKTLTDRGENPPTPVTGWALIDTGASATCIDRSAAEKAGLALVDSGRMSSATHDNEIVPIFAGRLALEGLQPKINANRAFGANLESQGLIALIGRDALSVCVFIYNGLEGTYSLSI